MSAKQHQFPNPSFSCLKEFADVLRNQLLAFDSANLLLSKALKPPLVYSVGFVVA